MLFVSVILIFVSQTPLWAAMKRRVYGMQNKGG
jgi:hypothetical protein